MLTKLLVRLLLARAPWTAKAVKFKGKIFVITIEEYVPTEIMLEKMESALGAVNTQSAKEST